MTALTVHRHSEQLAVCRLAADAPLPSWAAAPGRLRAAVRSTNELSIVCAIAAVPSEVRHEGPFTAFEVAGPLDLGLTGVLAALLAPLAAAGVSVLTLSTFDTDWILVPSLQQAAATRALQRAGHDVDAPSGDEEPAEESR
ncbi:MAG: ACT domain-containing protein [Pseudonocardiaceae bacterium]|nr:ACT domain-containing protein [Pseudonocardiaceae bacterium]